MKLTDYIQGNRRGKAANRLEREAMNDPFLQDAIDGFDTVPGDHLTAINELEQNLQQRIQRKKTPVQLRWWAMAAAAVIILFLGIGSLMRLEMKMPQNMAVKAPQVVSPSINVGIDSVSFIKPNPASEKRTIAQQLPKTKKITKKTEPNYESGTKSIAESTAAVAEQLIPPILATNNTALKTTDSLNLAYKQQATREVLAGRMSGLAVNTSSTGVNHSNLYQASLGIPKDAVFGKVVDEEGQPLIGVTVKYKIQGTGTITDFDGKFKLKTPDNKKDLLVANYIGYNKKELSLSDNLNEIKLEPAQSTLSEVVVVGYGSRKMTSTTGSITQNKTSDKVFGETEFKKYVENHRSKSTCQGQHIEIQASFTIDVSGKATNIVIQNSSCDAFKAEFTRMLIESPPWTITERKVQLTIRLK